MRSLILSLLALTAVAVSAQHVQIRSSYARSVRFTPGQTYVYAYQSRLLAGIPELQNQFSGLEIRADIILQAQSDQLVALKLSDIRVGKHNGLVQNDYQTADIPMDHQINAQYERYLATPIRFQHQDGKVKAFEADQSEPEWSLNMKKAILSLLNVNLEPKKIIKSTKSNQIRVPQLEELQVYPIYEEGIGGLCETVYQIQQIQDPQQPQQEAALVLNVTKTRNYDNCLTEPTIVNDNYDVRGCPAVCRKEKSFQSVPGYYPTPDVVTDAYMSGCPCGKEPHESPVDSYAFVKYNISLANQLPTIESIYAEGKTIYRTNGDQIIVFTQQNLTLTDIGRANAVIPVIVRPQRHTELSFRIPKPELPHGAKLPLDIPYYHLFGQPNVEELIQLVPEILNSLSSDVISGDNEKNSMQKSVQLVNALAVLPQVSLAQLYEQCAQPGYSTRATPKEQVQRKLFLDALPLCGSNMAALYIKELIQQNKVTTFEAKELVEAVPQNLFLIDTETIDAYLELFQSPKVQSRRHLAASTGIAFGKMVREACVKRQSTPGDIPDQSQYPHQKRNLPAQLVVANSDPQQASRVTITSQRTSVSQRMRRSVDWEDQFSQDLCQKADQDKYVQIIGRLLDQANAFHKKVTLIETLAHMGLPQALPVLEPYVSGQISQDKCPGYPVEKHSEQDEECDFIRQVAIYSLSHIAEHYPKQVVPLVAPVYEDQSEAYEVRIAAFTTLVFADAEKQVLQRIASELHRENNRQIRSFVYSSFQTIGNLTDQPCLQKIAQNAAQAYESAPHADYGYQYSKMIGHSFYDQQKDFGLYSLAEWVSSNVSRIPRSAYFFVGQNSGPFQEDLLQIGFSAKGVESLVERVLEPNGLISDMFEGMHAKGKDRRVTKRNADSAQQALESLKNKLGLEMRSDDEPKATVFLKFLDRTSYYPLDKHYIHQLIDGIEDSLKDIAQQLMQGMDYHYVKLVMPSQLYKVVPSEMGLPIVITHRHPTIFSLKVQQAKLSIETAPKTVYPTGVNITAQIQPSIFYSSYVFAFAINSAERQAFGAHVEKTTQLQFPVELSVGYSRPKNLLTWSVIPKVPQELVYHSTQCKTFIAKANIAGAPDRDWLQEAEEIHTQAVPFRHETTVGQEVIGLGVRVQMQSENPWTHESLYQSETYRKYGLAAALVEQWRNPGLTPREVHVQLEADQHEPISGYDFTLRYKWTADETEGKDSDDSDESSASDESDSDQSDHSSSSQSSESKSSESNSKDSSKSSKSSKSSEESNESEVKKQIKNRMSKAINRSRRSVNHQETNESSDESSNESGSKSWSKSGSKESSQSSSSESKSSEEKRKNKKNGEKSSQSAQSSQSDSSSSSQSDESRSMEDTVFGYEDVMKLILGQDFKKQSIKRIAKQLIQKTHHIWANNWDEDEDSSSEDKSSQEESTEIPQTIAHDFAVTCVARGPRPTYLAFNVLYVHTYDHRIQWLKTDGHIKAPKGVYVEVPTLYCADAVVSYPTIPNEFYYEPQQMQSLKARVQAQAGWGAQCHHQGGIIVTGVMEQTEDQIIQQNDLALREGQSSSQLQNWFYRQCQIDRSQGQSQSYACERAIEESAYFNQFIFDIKYKHVSQHVQNLTEKAALALKVALYPHVEVNSLGVKNPEEQIRIVAQYSSRIPDVQLANLYIQSPVENVQYTRIHVPYLRPISSLYRQQEIYSNLVQGYDSYDTCYLQENYVRTFDNVTYKTPSTPCQYLLAKDCSPKERFAVFAQTLSEESKTKSITILTAGQEIKLLPPQQQNVAQVQVDGHVHELTYRKAITLSANQEENIRIYLRATPSDAFNPIVVLESDISQLVVKYDGKNAKVTVSGEYAGKTCGLCGDNNNESEDEFAGPDMCVYEYAQDFAQSYALSGQHCEQRAQPKGEKRCPQKYQQIENNQQNYNQNSFVTRKHVKQVVGSDGHVTTVVRQETIDGQDARQQQQQLQQQSNVEEIARQQQKQVENQMARQEGEELSPVQKQQLYGASAQQQQIIQRLRTAYMERDDMVCFTTKPVLACIRGQPSAVKQITVDYHCLPKSSPFTQQLIQESQKNVIKQLVNKRVDIRQTIQVPVACIAA